jgi:hypothetical protein
MKKKILLSIVCMLLLATAMLPTLGGAATKKTMSSNSLLTPITIENAPIPRAVQKHTSSIQTIQPSSPLLADTTMAATESPEYHPTVAKEPSGILFGGYVLQTDASEADVYFTTSQDEGATWQDQVSVPVEGMEDYPAVDYWGKGKTFLGTFLPSPSDCEGSAQYLLRADDPLAPDTWTLVYWDWTTYNQRDKESPDVAGYSDVGTATWWYGVMVDTGSSDFAGAEGHHIPLWYFPDYADQNSGWIWYWNSFNNTAHAAVDVDPTNGYTYGVWDYDNESEPGQQRDLLLGIADVHKWWIQNWTLNWSTLGEIEVNETYPDVGAFSNNIMIVAQSDAAGNQDIICYYSSDGGQHWEKSTVVNDAVDELYPRIITYGELATCTFVKNGDLYCCRTEDGGATWDTPEKINDVDGKVESNYRTSDINTDGTVVWTDNRAGNLDCYYDSVGGPPKPILNITGFTAGLGITATIKNEGDAVATNVDWEILVTGGIFGRINERVNGTWDTLDIGEEKTTDSLGMFFGLGAITIVVNTVCDEGASDTETFGGTHLFIWTIIKK